MLSWLLIIGMSTTTLAQPAESEVLAQVNARPITARQLRLHLALNGVPRPAAEEVRGAALETLIDRALIAQFLEDHKAEASEARLEIVTAAARKKLAARGMTEVETTLLTEQLALPLAWRAYMRRIITEESIRAYHAAHERQLDGTRLRISQIFLKSKRDDTGRPSPQSVERLKAIRAAIVSGETSFAAAARQHSQSPSAEASGDIGWIDARGTVPAALSQAAYNLEKGDISEVIRSPFGLHLVTVTAVDPGNLSLADCRPAIIAALSQKKWRETVKTLRRQADITIDAAETAGTTSAP